MLEACRSTGNFYIEPVFSVMLEAETNFYKEKICVFMVVTETSILNNVRSRLFSLSTFMTLFCWKKGEILSTITIAGTNVNPWKQCGIW